MSYTRLRQQCLPQTIAITSNVDFIQPNVKPFYVGVPFTPPSAPSSTCDASGVCSDEGNSDWTNNPKKWGPHLWFYLHTAAMNYPSNPSIDQQNGMKNWLCSLKWTIPCKNCSDHYGSYIESHRGELPEVCASRDKLFEFLVKIHNKVNAQNGKPVISIEDAKKMYTKFN